MTDRATTRPATFEKPPHWTNDPAPAPANPDVLGRANEPDELSPTRYGDWVLKGIAVDF